MNIEQLLKSIRNNTISSNYLLFGPEHFFIDQIDLCFLKHIIVDEEKVFNQKIFYGKDTNVFNLIDVLKSFPMMGDRQLIILREAQELDQLDKLVDYLLNPVSTTVFVVCYKTSQKKKIDKRKKWVKLFMEKGVVTECKKIYENKISYWLQSYLLDRGVKIEKKAEALLIDFLGNDLSKITNAINKLADIVDEGVITFIDVQKHVGMHREYNNFELQSAVAVKNAQKLVLIVDYLISDSKNFQPQPIIGLLFSFFSKLLIMHSISNRDDKSIAEVIKVHPYFLKEYKLALSNYSFQKCVSIISLLKSADLQFKGIGGSVKNEFLKDLLLKIIN